MFIATGTPTAKFDGRHIVVTIPSGKDEIEVALAPARHTRLLSRLLLAATEEAFAHFAKANLEATVLEFQKPRRKRTKK